MKVFVTGGAGYIGSNLVDRLMQHGHHVVVYDNLSSGRKEFVEQHLANERFTLVEADLRDAEKVKEAMRGAELVFHLAANPDVLRGLADPHVDFENGTIITFNVLEAMRHNGVKKIVFSSSGTVYGYTNELKVAEDFGPILPVSLYGANKVAAEALVSGFAHIFGWQAYIFRFANVVGRHQTHGVIYDFINKLHKNPEELVILGDGNQTKHYILVDDVLDAIFFVLERAHETVNYYNIANPSAVSVTQIAQTVAKEMGLHDVKFTYTGGTQGWKGDVPLSFLSAAKINALGWKAKHDSAEAVRATTRTLLKEILSSAGKR
jgi:UDP-glucose 4-epimerase